MRSWLSTPPTLLTPAQTLSNHWGPPHGSACRRNRYFAGPPGRSNHQCLEEIELHCVAASRLAEFPRPASLVAPSRNAYPVLNLQTSRLPPRSPSAVSVLTCGRRTRRSLRSSCRKAFREWRRHLRAYRKRACRLAENRHIAWITSEGGDILVYPAQSRRLIHQSVVAGCIVAGFLCQLRMGEETEDPELVVQVHNHDAFSRQVLSLLSWLRSSARGLAAPRSIPLQGAVPLPVLRASRYSGSNNLRLF